MALYNVLFDIAARTAKFEEGMTRVDRRLEGMQRSATKMTKSLAGIFATGMVARWIASMAQAGDEMLALSQRTGRTVESVSQLSHVAARGNTTIEALTKAQDQLAKRLGATDEEGKAAAKALSELGLSAGVLRAMSLDRQLDSIADAMGSITDPVQRARLEMALFGKAGTELDNVLRSGAGGIRELREEADRLGITISTLEAERLAKLDDQIENTKGQLKSFGMELASVASIILRWPLEKLTQGFVGWKVMLGATGVELEEINAEITSLTGELRKLEDAQRHWDKSDRTQARIVQIKEEMAALAERQEYLFRAPSAIARYEKAAAALREKAAEESERAKQKLEEEAKAAEKAAEAYAKYREELAAIVEHEKLLNQLEVKFPTALLGKDELARELAQTGAMIQEQAEESEKVFSGLYERMADTFGQRTGEMTVYAEQAMRNIQGHLAEFLFDPFDKGLKGMLSGFVDTLRRMVAEIAAAQLAAPLKGWLEKGIGFLLGGTGATKGGAHIGGALGLPMLAEGGYIPPGGAAIVGDGGQPELAFGGRQGKTIVPLGGAGSVVYAPVTHVHVDSRTDRAAVRQDVLTISSEVSRRNLEQFRDYLSRGGR